MIKINYFRWKCNFADFQDDIGDPQLVVDYIQDIYKYLRFMEKEQSVKQEYLAGQTVSYRRGRSVEKIMEGSKVKVPGRSVE